jgi:hypothetical protein
LFQAVEVVFVQGRPALLGFVRFDEAQDELRSAAVDHGYEPGALIPAFTKDGDPTLYLDRTPPERVPGMTVALGKGMNISPENVTWCAGGEPRCPFQPHGPPVGRVSASETNAPPSDARDWLTTFRGKGRITVRVANASSSDIVLRLKKASEISGQAGVPANGTAAFMIDSGDHDTLVKMSSPDGGSKYYRGPALVVPSNAREVNVTLKLSFSSNLQEVSPKEFDK